MFSCYVVVVVVVLLLLFSLCAWIINVRQFFLNFFFGKKFNCQCHQSRTQHLNAEKRLVTFIFPKYLSIILGISGHQLNTFIKKYPLDNLRQFPEFRQGFCRKKKKPQGKDIVKTNCYLKWFIIQIFLEYGHILIKQLLIGQFFLFS